MFLKHANGQQNTAIKVSSLKAAELKDFCLYIFYLIALLLHPYEFYQWSIVLDVTSTACINHSSTQKDIRHTQARSQDLEKGGGGAFLKEWEKFKRPWPEFSLFLNQFHTVCPKIETKFLGKLRNWKVFSAQNQVVSKNKQKKKVFTEIETDFAAKYGNLNVWGGLFSIFHQKSASRSNKNVRFCIPPRPLPGYATGQWAHSMTLSHSQQKQIFWLTGGTK